MGSETLIDMPKVSQMLDAGWNVCLFKNSMGSYTASAMHERFDVWERARDRFAQAVTPDMRDVVLENDFDREGEICTDDFTPEQALTRLAYKVHGEII